MIRKFHFHSDSDRQKADICLFDAASLTLARNFVFMETSEDIEEAYDIFPSLNLDSGKCENNPEDVFEELKHKLKSFSCIDFEGDSIQEYSISIKKGTKLSIGEGGRYLLEFLLDDELPINLTFWDLYIIAEYNESEEYEEL